MMTMTRAALDAFQRGMLALETGRAAQDDDQLATSFHELTCCLEWSTDAQLRAEAHIALGDVWLARPAPEAAIAARHFRQAAEILLALALGGMEPPQ
jgi:hypothetical protein